MGRLFNLFTRAIVRPWSGLLPADLAVSCSTTMCHLSIHHGVGVSLRLFQYQFFASCFFNETFAPQRTLPPKPPICRMQAGLTAYVNPLVAWQIPLTYVTDC